MPTGSSDRWPDDYDRGRPGWPAEVVHVPGLLPAGTVLEVAAGTGKLTQLLVSAFGHVVALEPAEPMRRLLVARCPDAEAVSGSVEEIPLAAASFDAVFVAEAFHLFDGERALAEIARVLRPEATLVVMWNLPAGPTAPSIAAAEQFLEEHIPNPDELGYDPLDLNSKRYASGEWRRSLAASPFGEIQEARLPNAQTVDRDGLVAFFASMGWIADLPDSERLPLLDELGSLLDSDEYRRQWETHLYWTRFAAAAPT
jgi:SAM-dependent methyltransferase